MCRPDYTYEAEMAARLRNWGKRVYIAGPITGVEGYEKNFEKAAKLLRSKGLEPVSPTDPGEVEGFSYRDYINRGFGLLMGCQFICMLPGSNKSRGAMLELHYATCCGLPVLSVSDDYKRVLSASMKGEGIV